MRLDIWARQGVLVHVQDWVNSHLVVTTQSYSAITRGNSHYWGCPILCVTFSSTPTSSCLSNSLSTASFMANGMGLGRQKRGHAPGFTTSSALESIVVVGQMTVLVKYLSYIGRHTLYVVQGGSPTLLGRDWLQHVRLDWKSLGVVCVHDLLSRESWNNMLTCSEMNWG